MLPGGLLTPKGLVPGMEGRKPCRGTQTDRLTLCTSTLLPLGTVLCVTLWVMQGEGVALSQLVFLHRPEVQALFGHSYSLIFRLLLTLSLTPCPILKQHGCGKLERKCPAVPGSLSCEMIGCFGEGLRNCFTSFVWKVKTMLA